MQTLIVGDFALENPFSWNVVSYAAPVSSYVALISALLFLCRGVLV